MKQYKTTLKHPTSRKKNNFRHPKSTIFQHPTLSCRIYPKALEKVCEEAEAVGLLEFSTKSWCTRNKKKLKVDFLHVK